MIEQSATFFFKFLRPTKISKTSILKFFGFFCLMLVVNIGNSQPPPPPPPCESGTEQSCRCNTTVILCSIDELNGFQYSMDNFQHAQDGPTPMCFAGDMTVSNNPTWFGFTAWCTELDLRMEFSNCTQNGPSCRSRGLQTAVYSDCNNLPGSLVDGGCSSLWNCPNLFNCTGCQGCGVTSGTRILNLTNLTFGGVYYVLVDGCGGSACDVQIFVESDCGFPELIDFEEPIQGPTNACIGETVTFTSGISPGANTYAWFVDGMGPITQDRELPIDFTYSLFTEARDYEICVTAWHSPCIPLVDSDRTQCFTITIGTADAGTPVATPTPLCPGGTVDLSVSGHIDDPYYNQYLVVVNSANEIVHVYEGTNTTFTFPGCGEFTLYSLNTSGQYMPTPNPMVGQQWSTVTCTGDCCDIASVPFEFAEQSSITFDNPPADLTVNCIDDVPPMMSLPWVSVCGGSGTAGGVEDVGTYTPCTGGTRTRTWTVLDGCGENFSHVQNITIDPIPVAVFVDPPANETIECSELAGIVHPSLTYTNSASGACGIDGIRPPVTTGTATVCLGGTLTNTWTFTDQCMRTIEHVQTVTVTPSAVPTFVNPPTDVTINCEALATFMPTPLSVTNNDNGACLVSGTSNPTQVNNATVCGGNITVNWAYTDFCMRTITHSQVVTVVPAAAPAFVNPPQNITINCEDLAGLNPSNLSFTNNGLGACLFSGSVPPVVNNNATVCGGNVTYVWSHTDQCNNVISHTQIITVTPILPPAFINPPPNITINCEELAGLPPAPSLAYTNGGMAACLTEGNATPTVSGMATVCGGTITYTWNFTDQCNNPITHVQNIEVTPIEEPAFVNPPADVTIACHELAGLPPAPSLAYTNGGVASCLTSGNEAPTQSGMATICGGTITYTWDFTDQCNNTITHVQNIEVTPIEEPAFVNPPADVTIACHELAGLPAAPSLAYTNGGIASCLTAGNEAPTQSGMATICGGTITYTWDFTDQCNNTITHVQNIEVTPIEEPAFVNPPADVTIACHELAGLPPAPTLAYTNGGIASCLTAGNEAPTQSGMATICGGTITYTWDFTDQCNNTITHVQNIEVTPIEEPAFVNPPADVTIACNELAGLPPAPTLAYTNGGIGTCLTEGNETPTQSGMATICGGTITYTWDYTDQCNNTITHVQNIEVTPIEEPAFVNPPADMMIACNELANLPAAPTLAYTNNGIASCLTEGNVPATINNTATICGGTVVYTWEFTDQCMNEINHTQTLTVTPAAPPAFINPPGDLTIPCSEATSYNPLTLSYTNGGTDACLITGTVTPTLQGNPPNICGSNSTYTWTFTDQCNNTITHNQVVTVTPITPPVFQNPPANITVNCDQVPTGPADLAYANGDAGSCSLNGSVTGTVSGTSNACGGNIQYTWNFTDQCNNTIQHIQTITVNPAPLPVFVNPPANITVSCNQIPTVAPNLEYNNNAPGACSVQGFVPGVISGSANECGGVLTITWTYTDPCNNTISHIQTVTVTPALPPAFTSLPPNVTVTCTNVPGIPPPLTFTNNDICPISGSVPAVQSGSFNACGGVIQYTWQINTLCNVPLSHVQTVTVLPSQPPAWIDPPANITVSCADANPNPTPLSYTNNEFGACAVTGSVQSVVNSSYNACGGVINKVWNFTDICGRNISHSQTITVLPSAPPVFTNLPQNITVSCGSIPSSIFLNYSNSASGVCSIQGQVLSTESGSYTSCGGTMFNSWTYTDQCNRTISHQRQITVLPADDPEFLNPPADITLGCDDPVPPPSPISFSNNGSGFCNLFGAVTPVVTVNGNVTTYTYTWVHPCTGNVLEHIRNITSPPDPILVLEPDLDVACEGQGYTLSNINAVDFSGGNSTFTYYWDMPFEPGNEIIDPVIFLTQATEIYVVATNEFGCTDFGLFLIEIVPGPEAGTGSAGTVCSGTTVSLFSYLTGPYDPGQWIRRSGPAVSITNPNNVVFNTPGNYVFDYRVLGTSPCLDDFATVNITVADRPVINVLQKPCSPDKTTYDIIMSGQDLTVTASLGTVIVNPDLTVTIQNIPAGSSVTISVTHNITGCTNSLLVSPPNCDCPVVALPSNPVNQTVCFGQPVPPLSVNVGSGLGANWYDVPSGGFSIASNTVQFTPSNTDVGIYTYYVESFLLSDPTCVSTNRVAVTLTINELPGANPASMRVCDDNGDGLASFDLNTLNALVNGGGGLVITYHNTLAEAQTGNNSLPIPFTNTVPSTQTIYVSVANAEGCRSTAEITLTVSPQPNVTVVTVDESCDNANDGSVTVSTSSTGSSYEYRISGTSFSAQTVYGNLQPGNYTAFVRDALGCIGNLPFTIDPGLILTVNSFVFLCDDNDTRTNVTDDFYTISWNITNNNNNSGTYRVLENGVEIGVYTYNQLQSIQRPANGQILTYIFEDVALGCEVTRATNTLTPCSTDCEVIVNIVSQVCNDNNTPSNPSDDTYTITFSATALNNNANTSYNVFANNVFVGNFTYGGNHSIPLPADGTSPVLTFRDGVNLLCETNVTVGPLDHCSNTCDIEITQLTKVCDDNGTNTDGTDDTYTLTINAIVLNAGGPSNQFRVFVNGTEVAVFTYGTGGSFTLPADGSNPVIEIRDFDNAACTDTRNAGLLIPCSTDCTITINSLVIRCNDAGTGSDNSDDFYTIEFLVTAVNGAANGRFELRENGVLINTFAYGLNHTINLPADGNIRELLFTDSANASCFETRTTQALSPCSGACLINAVVSNIRCDNNGTTTNTADDRFFFDLTVTGTNTSAGYTFLFNNTQGTYNNVRTLGPFLISNGVINSLVTDNASPACTAVVTVIPPPPCSDGCALVVSNFQKTGCNNNGTNDTNDDDFYSVSFRVNTSFAGATQFNVVYNNNTFGPYNYGQNVVLNNVPANGVEYDFVITDISASNCTTSFKSQEFPCSVCSQVVTVSINPSVLDCNNNVATLTATSSAPGVFNWTGPNNYNQFGLVVQASFPGWYYFSAVYPDACERMDSVQLFADADLPQAIGGPDRSITCDVEEVVLVGSSNLPENQVRYIWYDSNGNVVGSDKTLLVTNPGTYFLEVVDITNNCTSGRDAVLVADDTDLPSAIIFADPGNILDCVIASVVLSGQQQDNVIFNWSFNEAFIGNMFSITINQEGTVMLTAIDTISGCENTGELVITDLTDYPSLFVDPVDPITCATNSTVINASDSPQGQNLVFTWFNANNQVIAGQTGSSLIVNSPGTYYVMLRDTVNGCLNIDTIFVDRIGDFPVLDVTDDVALYCGPSQANLEVNIINPTSATSITWSTTQGNILGGVSGSNILVEGSGTYVVEVVYPLSGCITTDSVDVIINTDVPESVATEIRGETCVNERDGSLSIVDISGGTPPYNISLNNQNYGQVSEIPSLAPGTYNLRITDANGCTKDTAFVVAPGIDVQLELEPFIELVAGDRTTLEVLLNVDPATISSVQWNPTTNLSCDTCLITELTALEDGVYEVKVTDINGCEATARIRVVIKDNVVINVPNIIKGGNNGGANGSFVISTNDQVLSIKRLRIYDRWGNMVFSNENFLPNDPSEGWNGTFNGRTVEQGVYVYVIEYVTRNGVNVLSGDLTVTE